MSHSSTVLFNMGCVNSVPRPPSMYLDPKGTLKVYDPNAAPKHNPKMQYKHVASKDAVKVRGGEEFYIISVAWLSQWIEYTSEKIPVFTLPIDNTPLVDSSNPSRLSKEVRFKKDFRLVEKQVWEYYFELYGGGPVMVLYGKYCWFSGIF